MNIFEYINNCNRNYMKIQITSQITKKPRYQYQILTTRKLECILSTNIFMKDEIQSLYYDITSMQNLGTLFTREKITAKWLNHFVANLQTALWSLEQYLLDERNIILAADTIFQDMESDTIHFLYYPYYIEEKEISLERFMDFLVEHVDVEESETVEKLYEIYSTWETMPSQFSCNTFIALWNKERMDNCVNGVAESDHYAQEILNTASVREGIGKKQEQTRKRDFTELIWNGGRDVTEEDYKGKREEQLPDSKDLLPINTDNISELKKTEYLDMETVMEEKKLFGNGRQNRKVIDLHKLPIVIGKKSDINDIILKDTSISRMHARITEEAGQIFLEDLNTTNGTYKNGVRLLPYERVELLREDEVRLGSLSFTYR